MEKIGLPRKLVNVTEWNLKLVLSDVRFESESLEKLKKLGGSVIFSVTHLSDWDITAFVNALGKETDIRAIVVQASSHYNWRDKPLGVIGTALAGPDNFLPVSYGSGKDKDVGLFRRNDYEPMKVAIEQGYSIIMAASHNREHASFNQRKSTLPEEGGGAAVYLARITGRPIVPVAVNMEGRWRGRAVIRVGEEMFIDKKEKLRDGSNRMMRALAEMLPESKRGRWR